MTNLTHKTFTNKTNKKIGLSDFYSIVSIGEAIQPLLDSGYDVLSTTISKVRNPERDGLQKHLVRLARVEDIVDYRGARTKSHFPTINVLNSHDGSTALRVEFGVFRMVCANGLWAGSAFESHRLAHRGLKLQEKVNALIPAIAASQDMIMQSVERLQHYRPSEAEIDFLASVAFAAKDLFSFNRLSKDALEGVLHFIPRFAFRVEDNSNDLWTIFNRLQELTVRGTKGFKLPSVNQKTELIQSRAWRPINSIDRNRAVNQTLWEAAEYVLEGKVA